MKKITLSESLPKRNLVGEIIASLLILFFLHSALSVSNYHGFMSLKSFLAFYTSNRTFFAALLIATEITTTILLFFPRTRRAGFIGALVMMILASLTIIYFPHYPHDFGGIFNKLSHGQRWLLIAIVSSLSVIGIIRRFHSKKHDLPADTNQVIFT